MKVGDKCPYTKGFTVTEIAGKCPHHDCDIVIAKNAQGTKTRRVCVECGKEGKKRYNDQYKDRLEISGRVRYSFDEDTDGLDASYMGWLWSAKADLAIDEFWRVRGMTDEMAKKKFGSKIRWRSLFPKYCDGHRKNWRNSGAEGNRFG